MLISWQLGMVQVQHVHSFLPFVLAIQLNIRAHVLKQSETTNNEWIKHGTWMYMVMYIYIYLENRMDMIIYDL